MNTPVKIYFFGDSICFGQYVSSHKTWVNRVSHKLDEFAADHNNEIIVQNPSRNGDTTRQALERMAYDVQSHDPDILYVQFGMNDCNYWVTDRGVPRVSGDAFTANLKEIITRALAFDVKHVFLATNHPSTLDIEPFPYTETTYQESNELYNKRVRDVIGMFTSKVSLIDIEQSFYKHAPDRDHLGKLVLADGLHLSEAGHDLYVEVVYPEIKNILLK
ncbi:SGNH/GDSL hydrolase family protein [Candidatus Latescibacterota bacterium]